MARVEPLAEKDKAVGQDVFQNGLFHGRPFFEEIILRVHTFPDFVAPALQNHVPIGLEVDAHIRPIQLFLDNQRGVRDEAP
jgi:hypothetical protein